MSCGGPWSVSIPAACLATGNKCSLLLEICDTKGLKVWQKENGLIFQQHISPLKYRRQYQQHWITDHWLCVDCLTTLTIIQHLGRSVGGTGHCQGHRSETACATGCLGRSKNPLASSSANLYTHLFEFSNKLIMSIFAWVHNPNNQPNIGRVAMTRWCLEEGLDHVKHRLFRSTLPEQSWSCDSIFRVGLYCANQPQYKRTK